MPTPISDPLKKFIAAHVDSLWALELLLLLAKSSTRDWSIQTLVDELRASEPLIRTLMCKFKDIQLVHQVRTDMWAWKPKSPEKAKLCDDLVSAYKVTPFAVMQIIVNVSDRRLEEFSDAFKVAKD